MPAGPKTTWEDLSNIGWPIQQVYDKANESRGHTMHGLNDLFLNNGIASQYQWWCYNVAKGSPSVKGHNTNSVNKDDTVWSYSNSQNSQPFKTTWSEKWTESTSATLSVTNSASISLSQSIEIPEVGGSEFSISVSTEDNKSQTKENSHELSNTWDITVGPHEKVSVKRTITTTTGTAEYGQQYGVEGSLGTKGDKYQDHYYWDRDVNSLLGAPTGTMTLQGVYTTTSYNYQLIREGQDGKKQTSPLPRPKN
ncbi:TEER-decreasing protein [Fomitiporia mediterranea MF3/22]|uniref:TEER-decreasing protein n=1 Tax=Fomitiporia mediterranea (strain MF3/22) TaxID=694068 RepID=UPI0004408AF7|nr:TEER-decreasing protein [Fomitiporia mediterranea MF3/22]EJC99840.1 TEER-decreasing protein [Fomitiporia mediterranea MF3/22]